MFGSGGGRGGMMMGNRRFETQYQVYIGDCLNNKIIYMISDMQNILNHRPITIDSGVNEL